MKQFCRSYGMIFLGSIIYCSIGAIIGSSVDAMDLPSRPKDFERQFYEKPVLSQICISKPRSTTKIQLYPRLSLSVAQANLCKTRFEFQTSRYIWDEFFDF